MGMAQQQILGQEFNVDQPPGRKLEIPRILLALLLGDQAAHIMNIFSQPVAALAREHGTYGVAGLHAKRFVAGDWPRPREHHMLPGFRFRGLVVRET